MSLKVKALGAVLVFCMAGGSFSAQEKKGEAQSSGASSSTAATPSPVHNTIISPEDAARKNPIKFTEASVDRGKKVYKTQCALCHGEKGEGKGDLATEMTLTLPDFTKPDALAKRTDGELFAIIGMGKDPMPSQKGRMTEPQLWNLVNYLRALGGKVPGKPTAKEAADENVILVPQ
ncbi:MAG: cytochrome c [Terriglobia bacterium]|jgi:mono/diheme cytochrome c family protein